MHTRTPSRYSVLPALEVVRVIPLFAVVAIAAAVLIYLANADLDQALEHLTDMEDE